MISLDSYEAVRALLATGMSQRAIAERTCVGRGTVGAIARGKRFWKTKGPSAHSDERRPLPGAMRCNGCGALQTLTPCACGSTSFRPPAARIYQAPAEPLFDARAGGNF